MKEPCPICGELIGGANSGLIQANIDRHIAKAHPEEVDVAEGEFSTDEPPRTKKAPASKSGGRRASRGGAGSQAAGIPLAAQLELPYRLGANFLQNRLPVTARTLDAQARPCAEAWDNFLKRYPALREKIEQGMIAGDVVALIMAHVPIIQAVRMEIAAQQMAEGHYEGGVPTGVPSAA